VIVNTLNNINLNGKRVLVRTDYNVPISNNAITDDFRIKESLKTINHLIDRNCKIIIMSHIGRPNPDNFDTNLSMKIVFKYFKEKLNYDAFFSNSISSRSIIKSKTIKNRQILILENLRLYKGEINNNDDFSLLLSQHADIYINDAFGTAHRSHASNNSIVGKFKEKGIGFLFDKEITFLIEYLKKPALPMALLIGGAKISSKIDLINNFIGKAHYIMVGGAMAFTFLKAMGKEIGLSLFEQNKVDVAKKILEDAKEAGTLIILPKDIVVASTNNYRPKTISVDKIGKKDKGYDIGLSTCKQFKEYIDKTKTLIWNGPMGVTEKSKYSKGTNIIGTYISELTINKILISIVGGGDTAASLDCQNICFTHLSTGGGASLELLSGKKLKALEVFKNEK